MVHFFSSVLREDADEILDPVHLLRGEVGLMLCSAISRLLRVGFLDTVDVAVLPL